MNQAREQQQEQRTAMYPNQKRWTHLPKAGLVLTLLLAWMLLAGCGSGRDEEATATPPPPSPTPQEQLAPTVAPTPIPPTAAPVAPESPLPTPQSAATSPLATPAASPLVPVQVDNGADCDIEPHLDLAGYPNLEAQMGCPVDAASLAPVAIQEFGEGPQFDRFMLWFSTNSQIYVLYADHTWQQFADTWQENVDPTFSCNPLGGEPDSPPLPRRGFGKLWCSDPQLQEAMGTVVKEERLCQHSVTQPFGSGLLLACFEDATIRYFRILNDGTWDVLVQ
ncbi:MAG: hypothetical protein KatS3mg050_0431 [Litorilinea sp.]|nr:MAG: hypothetical protein KatS3mg050_0431 [Litorilinea sp.]